MQKPASTLKLPKIDDFASQRGLSRFQQPQGFLSALNSPTKGSRLYQDSPERVNGSLSPQIGSLSSEKTRSYADLRDEKLFQDNSNKQAWILKKMEAQRETFQKSPQYLGIGQTNAAKATPKGVNLNQVLGSLPYENSPTSLRRRQPYEDPLVSKSLNMSSAKTGALGVTSKLSLHVDDYGTYGRKPLETVEDLPEAAMFGGRTIMRPTIQSAFNRNDKLKLPAFNNPEMPGTKFDSENEYKKVNMELIVQIDEKIKTILEKKADKEKLIELLKDYFELCSANDVIQVDSFFVDPRARKNIKSYLMLERISFFALLSIVNEEGSSVEANSTSMNSICSYLYSNFLNFVDAIVTRLDLIPRYSTPPNFEQLRLISKRKARDVDRSFGLEQINKLLVKVLRSYFKNTYKKGDRFTRLELLMEKIEFGLMTNYFDDLKLIFGDLLYKFNIIVPPSVNSTPTKTTSMASKTPVKPAVNKKLGMMDSPLKRINAPEPAAFLPPPVPKSGKENKPIYSLVLDMDETLIHFEEVAGRGRFFVRPHAEEFLKEMSELFEITVFTAGVQEYADAVLNILDPNKYITHRLYRHHVTINEKFPGIVKDLSKIGRDLTKTILVDNAPENFRTQLDNGIEIISWYNDPYDTELLSLLPFLKDLVENQVEDVRTAVRLLRENKKLKRH